MRPATPAAPRSHACGRRADMPARRDPFGRRAGSSTGPGAPSRSPERVSARPHLRMPTTRRTTRVAPEPAEPGRSPMRSTVRSSVRSTVRSSGGHGPSFTSRLLVLVLVLAVLGVSYTSSIRAWLNQRNEEQTLSAQITQQHEAIADLARSRQRWNDPAYIEDQARLRFGWVMPGERTFRVIGPDGTVLGTPRTQLASRLPAPAASAPWWSSFVGSVDAAATDPAEAKTSHAPARTPATVIPLHAGSGR